MSIKGELRAELQDALRARDRRRLDVIRQVETEVSRARSEPGFRGEVDDALYVKVIGSYVKRMDKTRAEYDRMGERGREMAAKLAYETSYLARWLPAQAGEEETVRLIRAALDELGVTDAAGAGRVVGHLMKAHPGRLDGALVNRLVRESLDSG